MGIGGRLLTTADDCLRCFNSHQPAPSQGDTNMATNHPANSVKSFFMPHRFFKEDGEKIKRRGGKLVKLVFP